MAQNDTPKGKEQVGFYISAAMGEALDAYIDKYNKGKKESDKVNKSQLIRTAVARYIGYTLSTEEISVGRPRKYQTEEEKKAAQEQQRHARQELIRRLIDEDKARKRQQAIDALQQSVDRMAASHTDNTTPTENKG